MIKLYHFHIIKIVNTVKFHIYQHFDEEQLPKINIQVSPTPGSWPIKAPQRASHFSLYLLALSWHLFVLVHQLQGCLLLLQLIH